MEKDMENEMETEVILWVILGSYIMIACTWGWQNIRREGVVILLQSCDACSVQPQRWEGVIEDHARVILGFQNMPSYGAVSGYPNHIVI